MSQIWKPATNKEITALRPMFSRIMRHRGVVEPDLLYVMRTESGVVTRIAMNYLGRGVTYSRWGFQNRPLSEIDEPWSVISGWLAELEGAHRSFIEAYPRAQDIVDTIPTRWFWLWPRPELPPEFNLKSLQ